MARKNERETSVSSGLLGRKRKRDRSTKMHLRFKGEERRLCGAPGGKMLLEHNITDVDGDYKGKPAKESICVNCLNVLRKHRRELDKKQGKKTSSKKKRPAKKPVSNVVIDRVTKPKATAQRTHVVLIPDHTGSMQGLAPAAMNDYNSTLDALQLGAREEGIETRYTLVQLGMPEGYDNGRNARRFHYHSTSLVNVKVSNKDIQAAHPMGTYPCPGNRTPLFQATLRGIQEAMKDPGVNDENTSFLVMVITDGQDNASRNLAGQLRNKIAELQATDRWTFVFRVPQSQGFYNYKRDLMQALGIPEGNIQEWETTTKGMQQASVVHTSSVGNYMAARSRGMTSTKSFYQTDTSNLSNSKLKKKLKNISSEVEIWYVKDQRDGSQIRDFCNARLRNMGESYLPGRAFYLLEQNSIKKASKRSVTLQEYKQIAIRDRDTGEVFTGDEARQLLGIPSGKRFELKPGDHGKWDIFVQSTSNNRKLFPGNTVLYWREAR